MSRTLLSRAESSDSTDTGVEDPQWSKLCDKLAKYMRNLNRHTGTLRKAKERLEERQFRDVENAKGKLADVMEKSRADVSLVHDTLSNLAKKMRANPGLKGHTQKIAEEAQEGIKKFEDAHRKLLLCIKQYGGVVNTSAATTTSSRPSLKGKSLTEDEDEDDEDAAPKDHRRATQEDRLARFRFSSHGAGAKKAPLSKRFTAATEGAASDDDDDHDAANDNDRKDTKSLLGQHQQQQQVIAADEFEQQLHDEIMAERKKEVQEIAENLADINEIFGHINQLVGEQGEQINVVEENVETAVVKMEKGNEELQAARRTIQKSNRRSLWLALGFVILLAIVVVLVTRFT